MTQVCCCQLVSQLVFVDTVLTKWLLTQKHILFENAFQLRLLGIHYYCQLLSCLREIKQPCFLYDWKVYPVMVVQICFHKK